MVWIVMLIIGGALVVWSRQVTEEVHTLAVQATSLISLMWGFAWAPPSLQMLIALMLGSAMILGK